MKKVAIGVVIALVLGGAIALDSLAGSRALGLGAMFLGLALFVAYVAVLGAVCWGAAWLWTRLRRRAPRENPLP
jgi:hypothetical protein